ncbi:MAG: hypothetical protein ACLUEQ_00655 [Cloacibacillus evryensis]
MSSEDRIRFSFTYYHDNRLYHECAADDASRPPGLGELDAIFDGYLTSTARQWAEASPPDMGEARISESDR